MNIEEAIDILTQKEVIDLSNHFNNTRFFEAIYIVLTAYEKEKRLAETNLKDSEEFQDNMCKHRCILNSKVEELESELEKEKEKNKELEKENKKLNLVRLQYLVSSFPDTTETYKKYKKELDEAIANLKEE